MPQNTTYALSTDWVLITDANITAATFQTRSGSPVEILATNGTTAPAAMAAGILYPFPLGERNATLADLFPGVSGANRLWARSFALDGLVFISHA